MDYFKYFNEVNKLNKYIRDENKDLWSPRPGDLDYINYDDIILDFILEDEENIDLAEIMRPSGL